jgi:dephospho-CoA kinase
VDSAKNDIFTVVLTGGIASGKTAAANYFSALNIPVIDTDRIAHGLVEPGTPALKQIRDKLGAEFLDYEGHLDRRELRRAIFADHELKLRLEAILHPLIAREVLRQLKLAKGSYCIVVIPLYSKKTSWITPDRVLVIDVPEELQISRVMERDHTTRLEALSILASQPTRETRKELADDILTNDGTFADLKEQLKLLHEKYLSMASSASSD